MFVWRGSKYLVLQILDKLLSLNSYFFHTIIKYEESMNYGGVMSMAKIAVSIDDKQLKKN